MRTISTAGAMTIGELARQGRDKLTIIASPGISDMGAWLEQLIAESTGKNGKGLVPAPGESPDGPDRQQDREGIVLHEMPRAPDRMAEPEPRRGQILARVRDSRRACVEDVIVGDGDPVDAGDDIRDVSDTVLVQHAHVVSAQPEERREHARVALRVRRRRPGRR